MLTKGFALVIAAPNLLRCLLQGLKEIMECRLRVLMTAYIHNADKMQGASRLPANLTNSPRLLTNKKLGLVVFRQHQQFKNHLGNSVELIMPRMYASGGGSEATTDLLSNYAFDNTVQKIREGKYIFLRFPNGPKETKYGIFDIALLKSRFPQEELDDIPYKEFTPKEHLQLIMDRIQKKNLKSVQTYHTNVYWRNRVVYILEWPKEDGLTEDGLTEDGLTEDCFMCTKTNYDQVVYPALQAAQSPPVEEPAETASSTNDMNRNSRQGMAPGNSSQTGWGSTNTPVSYPALTHTVPMHTQAFVRPVPQMMQPAPPPALTTYNVTSSQAPIGAFRDSSPFVPPAQAIAPSFDRRYLVGDERVQSIEQENPASGAPPVAWGTRRLGSRAKSTFTTDRGRQEMETLRSGVEVYVHAKDFPSNRGIIPAKTQCIVYIPSQDLWTKFRQRELDDLVRKVGIVLIHQDDSRPWNPKADSHAWNELREQWTADNFTVIGLAFRTSTRNENYFLTTVIVEPIGHDQKKKVQDIRKRHGCSSNGPLRITRTDYKRVGMDEMLESEAMRTEDGRNWLNSLDDCAKDAPSQRASRGSRMRQERLSMTPESEVVRALLDQTDEEGPLDKLAMCLSNLKLVM